jgi:hypothetical protein
MQAVVFPSKVGMICGTSTNTRAAAAADINAFHRKSESELLYGWRFAAN